jgi:hypothetical protein
MGHMHKSGLTMKEETHTGSVTGLPFRGSTRVRRFNTSST